jgi:hypothetical protein
MGVDWGNVGAGVQVGLENYQAGKGQRDAYQQAAQMFASLGTPSANGYARLLMERPETAMIMAKEMGGPANLYKMYQQEAQLGIANEQQKSAGALAGRVLGPEYADSGAASEDVSRIATARAALDRAKSGSGKVQLSPEQNQLMSTILQESAEDPAGHYEDALFMATEAGIPVGTFNTLYGGIESPKKTGQTTARTPHTLTQEQTIRGDYSKDASVSLFPMRANAYRSAEGGYDQNSAGGDLQLVYNAIKLWDPTAVREGEIALARDTASIPAYLADAWSVVKGGRVRLPAKARNELINSVRSTMSGTVESYDDARQTYVDIAESQREEYPGLSVERAVPDFAKKWRAKGAVKAMVKQDALGNLESDVPKGLPEGATLHGVTSDGKRVFLLPNGKYATEQ